MVGGRGGREQGGRNRQQGTRDGADAPSLVPLLSASVLRGRDEPPCSSLLCSEVAGRDEVVVVAGRGSEREGEGRNGQQSTSDDADAPSLVHLLSASVLRVCDELSGSSLFRFGRAERDREEDGVGGRVEEGRNGQQGRRDDADALSLLLCFPPPSSVSATSLRARGCWGSRARRGGRARTGWSESRSGQPETTDDADVPSLVRLLSASIHRLRDEPRGSSLLMFQVGNRVGQVDELGCWRGRVEEGRGGQQSTSDDADAPSLVLCCPPPSSVDATSIRARRC